MDTIYVNSISDVWPTIRNLPPGKTILLGSLAVVKDAYKCVYDYSSRYTNTHGDNWRPLMCAYAGGLHSNPRMTCSIQVTVNPHQWIDFEPNRSLKIQTAVAIEQLRTGNVEEVNINCSPDQVAQVRNHVSGNKPVVSVRATETGCKLRFKYEDNSSLSVFVRECLMTLSPETNHPIKVDVDLTQVDFAKRLITRIAYERGVRISISHEGKYLVVTVKPDRIVTDCDKLMSKWTSRGRHHLEVLEAMQEAVERHKAYMLADLTPPDDMDDEPAPAPPPQDDDDII